MKHFNGLECTGMHIKRHWIACIENFDSFVKQNKHTQNSFRVWLQYLYQIEIGSTDIYIILKCYLMRLISTYSIAYNLFSQIILQNLYWSLKTYFNIFEWHPLQFIFVINYNCFCSLHHLHTNIREIIMCCKWDVDC